MLLSGMRMQIGCVFSHRSAAPLPSLPSYWRSGARRLSRTRGLIHTRRSRGGSTNGYCCREARGNRGEGGPARSGWATPPFSSCLILSLHTGQTRFSLSHLSMHTEWKKCRQGSVLRLSPSTKSSRQIEQLRIHPEVPKKKGTYVRAIEHARWQFADVRLSSGNGLPSFCLKEKPGKAAIS